MEWIANPDIWVSLLTLTALEIVLGIDNLVFIAILSEALPEHQRKLARRLGLLFALVTRILLLLSISWIMGLRAPLFEVMGEGISGRDIILLVGGLFLIGKATFEIHDKIEGDEGHSATKVAAGMVAVVAQIAVLDIVFSLDSVITAVGMANHVEVMVAAIVIAVGIMVIAAEPVSAFINAHPTVKMLALSFLILIGVMLVADGMGFHIPKGYIYFAMGFSCLVEGLNLAVRRRRSRSRGASEGPGAEK